MQIIKFIKTNANDNGTWLQRIIRYLLGIVIILIMYLALALLYIYPHLPIDTTGWAILLLFGVPITLIMERLAEIVFKDEIGQRISNKKCSIKRIIIALCILLTIIGVLYSISILLWPVISPHFK